jgi:hypothetical protein
MAVHHSLYSWLKGSERHLLSGLCGVVRIALACMCLLACWHGQSSAQRACVQWASFIRSAPPRLIC